MKLFAFLGIIFLAGCATADNSYSPVDVKAKNYEQALQSADKSCKVDADCTAVNKGCCLCHGKEAVNKDAAAALENFWMKDCGQAACTLQMCYVEINTSCQQGKCVGTPKPMKDYAVF